MQIASEVARIRFYMPFSGIEEGTPLPVPTDFLLVKQEVQESIKTEARKQAGEKAKGKQAEEEEDAPDPVTGITKAMTRKWQEKMEQMKWEMAGSGPRPGGKQKLPDVRS